ncbi:MAG: STAS domain-containing protein [Verrucomicrobiales bacterium]|nr:STAS domain-containing protein [Verrucomicrobiales bacterium]
MSLTISFKPKLWETLRGYSGNVFRRDFVAAINVMVMAFPLSVAFAIASGAKPEQGLFSAILGGALVAAFGGSRVQIGGPTGAFVVITYGILQQFGADGLAVCTALAGAMLGVLGLARLGSVIRFIPYPVSRAFTKGIAVLILSSQIKSFLGLPVEKLPVEFVGKLRLLAGQWQTLHLPTLTVGVVSLAVMGWWPKRGARFLPGTMAGLVLATAVVGVLGLDARLGIATLGTQFGGIGRSLPTFHFPAVDWAVLPEMIQPAFTIAMLAAMQALLCAVVTDGMLDERHDSNQELVGQGLANLVGAFLGCLPVTGAVARSVVNVRSGARTPVAGLIHSGLLLGLLLLAAPLLYHVPLAALSAVLVLTACRMVSWSQFLRLTRWPLSDSSVFLATFALTVLTNLTLAVEVGVVLAALLMVKRISETSQITAVDESTETEGSQHSLIGRRVPPGVLVFRVFGAFFFGVVDKLDDELKRARQEPEVLILRVRKVLAMDATGLQALEDLHAKLRAKNKHLILSAAHTQPLMVMENAGFLDRLGRENVCANIVEALARARVILGLPPEIEADPLRRERERLEQVQRELQMALARAQTGLPPSSVDSENLGAQRDAERPPL